MVFELVAMRGSAKFKVPQIWSQVIALQNQSKAILGNLHWFYFLDIISEFGWTLVVILIFHIWLKFLIFEI